ncbi:MAG: hypothetical protein R3B70_10735 [Polyangiaceae bacterium]
MNQGMALAVEAPFHTHSTIDTICKILNPPKPDAHRFLGTFVDERGAEVTAFQRGQHLQHDNLAGRPLEYRTKDEIVLPLLRRDGTELRYTLRLPFNIIDRVSGSDLRFTQRTHEQMERRLSEEADRVAEYVEELLKDPSLNADFDRFVTDNDVVLWGFELTARAYKAPPPDNLTTATFSRQHLTDLEVALRYFIKIALLFAAEMGEPRLLRTPEAETLRSYLTGLFVEPALASLVGGECARVFTEKQVAGELAYWWSDDIEVTQAGINTVPSISAEQREKLHVENELRLVRLNTVRPLVHLDRTGTVSCDSTFHEAPNSYAYHELRLHAAGESPRPSGAWCEIILFGGLFRVHVQLSSDTSIAMSPVSKRIDTSWYH